MPGATKTAIANVSTKEFFEVIRDYERYPEFVENMTVAEVLKRSKKGARVRFVIKVIKQIEYTIDTVEHLRDSRRGAPSSQVSSGSCPPAPRGQRAPDPICCHGSLQAAWRARSRRHGGGLSRPGPAARP
ncbi:MAG: hypothetical protein HY815_10590 [Candidatus Riflebacteria bacterium]|nr:hypothetical protein [Candidatus Riflebacteria bacterium]